MEEFIPLLLTELGRRKAAKVEDSDSFQRLSDSLWRSISTYHSEVRLYATRKLILFVSSAFDNVATRHSVRKSWGNKRWKIRYKLQIVFFVGRPKNGSTNLPIDGLRRSDVVMADFIDDYRNLTLKTLSILQYARMRLPERALTLLGKIDDDVQVDVRQLVNYESLFEWRQFPRGLECMANVDKGPVRETNSKWFVSRADIPSDEPFPDYCIGAAYFFYRHTADLLLETLRVNETRIFVFEDVFVTGMLRVKANLSILHQPFMAFIMASEMKTRKEIFAHLSYEEDN